MVVIRELPTDTLIKIQSFLIGKPEQIKIKNNKKFNELQRLFKINYIYRTIRVLNTMVTSSYEIRGLKLKPNILLKQEDRLEKMWGETYETFKSKYALSRPDCDSYVEILSFGDDYELLFDEKYHGLYFFGFLQKATLEIEQNMRYYNCKIGYIDLSVCFEINSSDTYTERYSDSETYRESDSEED